MKSLTTLLCLAAVLGATSVSAAAPAKPNVLLLYIDDMGYADTSLTGNKQCPTPNIDSIAKNGVRFENSYVTACVCSPSRAALMSGRYQQRFGFDANAEGGSKLVKGDAKGLDLSIKTFANRMKDAGYATGLVGKWHLGSEKPEYLPNARGFDEFYGLLPHGVGAGKAGAPVPMWRNTESAPQPADHTVAFGEEACAFIDRHKDAPWLLYCAFTAVHAPFSAPESYLKKYSGVQPPARARYLAMLACLDDQIGNILGRLKQHGLEENTLVFIASDNGGPGGAAENGPYRGTKWTLLEGGIRSPIFIQWKGHIPAGRALPYMVTQLDWMPTALAAAGIDVEKDAKLDGVNLLPFLEGKSDVAPRDTLYWRFGVQFAVRQGDWKLVKSQVGQPAHLYNLATDAAEHHDLAAKEPARAKDLLALWEKWNVGNEPPRWIDERWNGDGAKGKKLGAEK